MNFKEIIRAFFSGILLTASFAPWEPVSARNSWAILAWIAWTPLLSCLIPIDPEKRCKDPFRLGFLTGLIFWFGTIFWLANVSGIAMAALAVYLALYPGAWALLMARLGARWPSVTGPVHLLLSLAGASAWVTLEWLRGWILGGFPWNFAAVSQYQNLALIQIAEWTGVYGVSFALVFFNLALWLTWRRLKIERFSTRSWRYEFSIAILLVAFCLMTGMRRLLAESRQTQNRGGKTVSLKLALIQPDIPQAVKYEPFSRAEQQDRLRYLTLAAAAARPDLIIWPETALVNGPNFDMESQLWLLRLIQETKIPLLFGTIDETSKEEGSRTKKRSFKFFNAAMFAQTDGEFAPAYHKLHLVPFGEYVPFERWLPWMRYLTPIPGSFDAGKEAVCFDCKSVKLGPLICFEDTFPRLSRNLNGMGADLFVNLTNDAWFKKSPGAAMHLANAVFRAIENRRPLVRCANHGVTCIVDSSGRIEPQRILSPFAPGFLITEISCRRNAPDTFYHRHGDWFVIACAVISGLIMINCFYVRHPSH